MNCPRSFLKSLHTMYWQNTLRWYAKRAKIRPIPIDIDAKVTVPKGLEENWFKNKPEHLFLEEVKSQQHFSPSIHQVHYLAEERKRYMKALSNKIYFKTIEKKYFKPAEGTEPNLLTWDMKEHMRTLNSLDPETWNPLTLSNAFPMSAAGIKNVLRSRKRTLTPEELKEHDMEVVENWKKITKEKIGNYALLKKIIRNRISTMSKESSLPVPSNTPTDVFQGVTFSPTDDMTVDEIREQLENVPNKVNTKWRKKRPSFKDIITNYKDLHRQSTSSSSKASPEGVNVEKSRLSEQQQNWRSSRAARDDDLCEVAVRIPQDNEYLMEEREPPETRPFEECFTLEEYKKRTKLK